MKKPKMLQLARKTERRAGSDTAKLFWTTHINAMNVVANNLSALNENLVRAMARFDDIDVSEGWRWNADTQHWERDSE